MEFADFQCPYCKQEAGVVRNQLMAAFPGQIQLIYMDYPLESIHPFARGAAIMGRCIYTQNNGSFWSYHDWIFQHQGEIHGGESACDGARVFDGATRISILPACSTRA